MPRFELKQDYSALRRGAYPPVEEGLDAVVKGGEALEEYRQRCLQVKADFPKPDTAPQTSELARQQQEQI